MKITLHSSGWKRNKRPITRQITADQEIFLYRYGEIGIYRPHLEEAFADLNLLLPLST